MTALSAVDFNNSGGPLMFNHPTGIATDGRRLLVADRFNNRVLVWTTLPNSEVDAPTLVLGQPDLVANNPGAGRGQMNWPTAVSVSPEGRLVVADGYNHRLLIWNEFPTTNGQPADLELRHQDLEWPWGVWTDGRRIAATSTARGKVLFWSTFPTRDHVPPAHVSTGGGHFGTPRTITTDGNAFAVGDHNSRGPLTDIATHVWRRYPTGDSAPDFAMRDPVDGRYAWLTGDVAADGRLVMLGRYLHVWDSFAAADAPPTLTLDAFPFTGGDGADVAIAGDRVFVAMYNGNRIVVYRGIPDADRDPDFALGSPDLCTNTLDTRFLITNPVPATDGRSLFVSSDFDRRLYVWKDIPAESGAPPDLVYSLPEAPWDNGLHGNVFALAGERTVHVWHTLPLAGEMPETVFRDRIGSAQFTRLMGVAIDGRYFALSDDSGKVWIWEGVPHPDQEPLVTLSIERPGRIQSDGRFLVVNRTDPPAVFVYRLDTVGPEMTPHVQLQNRHVQGHVSMNLPMHAVTGDNHLFVADTVNNRVLVWTHMDSVRSQNPDVILGASSLSDVTPAIGRDTLFWPGALAYDGGSLWVGEFKFANRLVRFPRLSGDETR